MKVPDLNILVAAFRVEHTHHQRMRTWLRGTLAKEQVGLASPVATGVVRLLTNPAIWPEADTVETALGHIDALRQNGSVTDIAPGAAHWSIFAELCRAADARGNLASDAVLAAIAVEHGATLVSFDRDFAKFPGLRWELPELG